MGKLTDEELDLQTTIMGIRETLMSYFKGTCIERLSGAENIYLESIYTDREPYQYQRQARERRNECQLSVSSVPIIKVQQLPDTITMLNTQLGRSKQFRAVRESILDFMHKYLQGVVVKEEGTLTKGRRDDSGLIVQSRNHMVQMPSATDSSSWIAAANSMYGINILSPNQQVYYERIVNTSQSDWIVEDTPF